MKKTIREIQLFAANAQGFLDRHPEQTKMSYALKKMLKRFEPILQQFGEDQEDANVEHAMVDDKGALATEDGRYRFTPEGQKKRTAKVRELMAKQIEFEPHYAQRPENVGELESLVFEDYVLEAEVEPEAEAEVAETTLSAVKNTG